MNRKQHKKIIKALKRFLKDDQDFKALYLYTLKDDQDFKALHLDTLKAITNKAPSMFSDFIINAIDPFCNPKKVNRHYLKMLGDFLMSFDYDLRLNFYIIDEPYLDIAWLRLEDMLIDLDKLYLDFKAYIEG